MSVNRLCYIPEDKSLNVDGHVLFNVYADWVPKNVHAVQWYGEHNYGEVEFKPEGGPLGSKPLNERITELGEWEKLVDLFYQEKKSREDAEIAAAEAAEAARDYWAEMRGIRDDLLLRSDWTQLPDVSLTEEQKEAWSVYRQQLRDLPGGITDPKPMVLAFYLGEIHPDWPVKPQ